MSSLLVPIPLTTEITEIGSPTSERGDPAEDGAVGCLFGDSHVETIQASDQNVHDLGCNLLNIGVLIEVSIKQGGLR